MASLARSRDGTKRTLKESQSRSKNEVSGDIVLPSTEDHVCGNFCISERSDSQYWQICERKREKATTSFESFAAYQLLNKPRRLIATKCGGAETFEDWVS